jgi:hypothetical protein
MNTPPRPDNYLAELSRLPFYPGNNKSINGELWLRHLRIIEILEEQAVKLGMPAVVLELAILREEHVAAQFRHELGGKP